MNPLWNSMNEDNGLNASNITNLQGAWFLFAMSLINKEKISS